MTESAPCASPSAPRSAAAEAVLRPVLWLLLGGWIGAMSLFSFSVATAAFRVLPSPELAGHLVGQVLRTVHLWSIAAGLILAILAGVLGRGRIAVGLPLLLAALCLVNQTLVSPAVAEIHLADPATAADPELARRFARLHGLSMTLFGATLLGALVLAAIHGFLEAGSSRSRKEGGSWRRPPRSEP